MNLRLKPKLISKFRSASGSGSNKNITQIDILSIVDRVLLPLVQAIPGLLHIIYFKKIVLGSIYLALTVTSLSILFLVPFEKFVSVDLAISINMGLLAAPLSIWLWQFFEIKKFSETAAPSQQPQSSPVDVTGNEKANEDSFDEAEQKEGIPFLSKEDAAVVARYRCNHVTLISRSQVQEWIDGGSIPEIDLSKELALDSLCISCTLKQQQKHGDIAQASEGRNPSNPMLQRLRRKRILLPSIAATTLSFLLIALFVTSGLDYILQQSGLAGSVSRVTNAAENLGNMASQGGGITSGKTPSIEDLQSIQDTADALGAGNTVNFTGAYGIKPYSFSDGYVVIKNTRFDLEVPDTDDEKSRGLSFSKGLKPDQAFLVQYPSNERMDPVYLISADFHVDILWLDGAGKIVDEKEMVTECNANSVGQITSQSAKCTYQSADSAANSILYLDGGMIQKIGIKKRDIVAINILH